MELDRKPAVSLLLEQLVGATIPDLDGAGSVLSGRDLALEVGVVERMVLDVHCQVALAGLLRNPLRHGPAGERPAALQPQVVVQTPRSMALHDEYRAPATLPTAPERLRRARRIALAAVVLERHVVVIPPVAWARELHKQPADRDRRRASNTA